MSAFSAVDQADEPQRLVEFLDESAAGLAAMKQYVAVAHALRSPASPVLDLGCGAGHDLSLLENLGLAAVGVDPSSVMLTAASARSRSPLVRAVGGRLPFADGAFGGYRIERVLMHVADPVAVLAEVIRCVQPNALVTIFEPDWSSLTVNGSPVPVDWVSIAEHPAIGSSVGGLLAAEGCSILDRVEERSWWTFAAFVRITHLERSLDRAVVRGKASRSDVEAWLAEQRRRAAAGEFQAEIAKVLWVATTPLMTAGRHRAGRLDTVRSMPGSSRPQAAEGRQTSASRHGGRPR